MTEENLKKCISLKGEMKKLKGYMVELPKLKHIYTVLEYKTRGEFYDIQYNDRKETYKDIKKKLTLVEKIKLVIHHEKTIRNKIKN
jgi:hypothetical protein